MEEGSTVDEAYAKATRQRLDRLLLPSVNLVYAMFAITDEVIASRAKSHHFPQALTTHDVLTCSYFIVIG
jgi:hypothetical protein